MQTPDPRPRLAPHNADIGYLLNRVTRRLRLRLADALADTGLTPQQAAVLLALARSDAGRLTPSAIAIAIDADQATASGLLERLSRDGWLESGPNPSDRRSRLITLTPAAEEAVPRVLAAADAVTAEATASLTAEEVSTLTALLSRLAVPGEPTASARAEAAR